MKRLVSFFCAILLFSLLVIVIRIFQFDPAEALKEPLSQKIRSNFEPARLEFGEFIFDFKAPFRVRVNRFAVRAGDSALKAGAVSVPATPGEILSGKLYPNNMVLEKSVFEFSSFRDLEVFLGNPFLLVSSPQSDSSHSLDDFEIRGEEAEFFFRNSGSHFPNMAFRMNHFSLDFTGNGYRIFRAGIPIPDKSILSAVLSSDPQQKLVILNLNIPEKFDAKAEFYPGSSRTAYRIQAELFGQDLSSFFPQTWKLGEFIEAPLTGKISAHSAANGTLRGRASLEASEGILRGTNLPYEILRSLTRLPLFSRLMEVEWKTGLLKGSGTRFDDAGIEMSISGRELLIEDLTMLSSDYAISLEGGINFTLDTGTVNMKGEIFITGALAGELLEKEPLFEALATPEGLRLEFLCLGRFPGLKVETDINDAAALILKMENEQIAAKGIDSLNRYMESKK